MVHVYGSVILDSVIDDEIHLSHSKTLSDLLKGVIHKQPAHVLSIDPMAQI